MKSIPFFQTISYDAILEPLGVPEDIIRQAPISVVSDGMVTVIAK